MASQIVLGLQTVVSRQIDLTTAPAVVTVGTIEGGSRHNIVPDQVRMSGTIRTFDPDMRKEILARVKRTAESIAAAAGATAELILDEGYPVTWNDPALTERMTPSLKRVAAGTFNPNAQPTTTSEDFSFYGQKVPALYFFLGVAPKGVRPGRVGRQPLAPLQPRRGGAHHGRPRAREPGGRLPCWRGQVETGAPFRDRLETDPCTSDTSPCSWCLRSRARAL